MQVLIDQKCEIASEFGEIKMDYNEERDEEE